MYIKCDSSKCATTLEIVRILSQKSKYEWINFSFSSWFGINLNLWEFLDVYPINYKQ